MSTDPMFGWDLTFRTVEKDIKRKSDVLVAFIHWNLMKRGFRSIGVGDEVNISFISSIPPCFYCVFNTLKAQVIETL